MIWASALGLNLWILAVAVPLAVGGAAGSARSELVALALFAAAPALLAWGVWRKSEPALLVAFPVAALLPQALWAWGERATLAAAPWPLMVISLGAYLLAATWTLAERERSDGPREGAARKLPHDPIPPRWKRRLRVYRALAGVTALFPLALTAFALSPQVRGSFAAGLGAGSARAHALLVALVGVGTLVLVRAYVLAPLTAHLHHDRDMAIYSEVARKRARRGRPRPVFYLFVLLALVAMALTVWLRSQPGVVP
jgi:hypothetical protein